MTGTIIKEQENSENPILAITCITETAGSNMMIKFIFLLVLILEPLSIGLTVATNAAWMNDRKSIDLAPRETPSEIKDLTKELVSLQKEHGLTVPQIAKITGRKKLKTCQGWIEGTIPTPPRVLAEVQAWVEKEYVKRPDG